MKKKYQVIDRRDFFKKAALGVAGLSLAPSLLANVPASGKLRTVHIGLGGMGMEDLKAIASHASVEVVGLCDVDTNALSNATALYPQAKTYSDYRLLLKEMEDQFDAVVVSTPDHTHAPASLMAMEMNKAVYCQKPLTHHVTEARAMKKMAEDKNLVTQMLGPKCISPSSI